MQIPSTNPFLQTKYWWFLRQWSSCFSSPAAHACVTSKRRRANRRRESRIDVCCTTATSISLHIRKSVAFRSMSKELQIPVKNHTAWTLNWKYTLSSVLNGTPANGVRCRAVSHINNKSLSQVTLFCLYLWLLFCGCQSPASVVQQAQAQLLLET